MSLPIEQMLTDVRLVEERLERLGATVGLVGDLCCHIKALAGEVEAGRARLNRWRDEIRAVLRILEWNGHTTAVIKLEMLLGES
jgi:hypothetical protein